MAKAKAAHQGSAKAKDTPTGKPPRPPGMSPAPGAGANAANDRSKNDADKKRKAKKKKAEGIISEYLSLRDVEEAMECIKELDDAAFHGTFVALCIQAAFEKREQDVPLIGELLAGLASKHPALLTRAQLDEGFQKVFPNMEDIVMDHPKAAHIVGGLLGGCIAVDCMHLGLIHPLNQEGDSSAFREFLASRHGRALVVSVLTSLKKAGVEQDRIKEIWAASGLHPSDWMPAADANAESLRSCFSAADLGFLQ